MAQFIQKWRNRTKDSWVKKTYGAWLGMRRRCYNSKDKNYHNYGQRGIGVCDRWRDDFDAFVSDMGFAPERTSIERMDVDGGYDPFNCVWATRKEQANNTRKNVRMTFEGRTMTATQWAEETGVPATRILQRIHRGWTPERIIDPKPYEAPHGSNRKFVTGCRCEICVTEVKKRRQEYHYKKQGLSVPRPRGRPRKYDL